MKGAGICGNSQGNRNDFCVLTGKEAEQWRRGARGFGDDSRDGARTDFRDCRWSAGAGAGTGPLGAGFDRLGGLSAGPPAVWFSGENRKIIS